VVALNKTSNKLRFCIDYRELNEATETYMHPIPNIPDTIKSLKGKRLFANLDMKLGFHQLLIKDNNNKLLLYFTKV
jgi:putative transposase